MWPVTVMLSISLVSLFNFRFHTKSFFWGGFTKRSVNKLDFMRIVADFTTRYWIFDSLYRSLSHQSNERVKNRIQRCVDMLIENVTVRYHGSAEALVLRGPGDTLTYAWPNLLSNWPPAEDSVVWIGERKKERREKTSRSRRVWRTGTKRFRLGEDWTSLQLHKVQQGVTNQGPVRLLSVRWRQEQEYDKGPTDRNHWERGLSWRHLCSCCLHDPAPLTTMSKQLSWGQEK